MQSQSIPVSSESTLDLFILYLKTNQTEKILELFQTDPDGMFAVSAMENIYFHRTNLNLSDRNSSQLMEMLSFQYIADKTRLQEWDKAAAFYIGVSRYFAQYGKNDNAFFNSERALFYLKKYSQKMGASYNPELEIIIEKEMAVYIANYYELITKEEDQSKQQAWQSLYTELYLLDRIIETLGRIQAHTNSDEILENIAKYQVQLAQCHNKIANYFSGLAESAAESDEESDTLVERRLRYSQVHSYLAQSLLKKIKPDKEEVTEFEDDELEKITTMVHRLAELKSTNANSIKNYIETHDIDIDEPDDFIKAIPEPEKHDNRATPLVNLVITSGSLATLKVLIEELDAETWLFATEKLRGLLEDITIFTSPDIIEYLFTPNDDFYQIPEQKECIDFYLDAGAGRLDKVQETLQANPDLILQYPNFIGDEEKSIPTCVLDIAIFRQQAHVVNFLVSFIADYIAKNIRHESLSSFMEFFPLIGKCTRRRTAPETVLILQNKLKEILERFLTSAMNELQTKQEELSNDDNNKIATYRYYQLLLLIADLDKLEFSTNNQKITEQLNIYLDVAGKMNAIISEILNLDQSSLPKSYSVVCQSLAERQDRLIEIIEEAQLQASMLDIHDEEESKSDEEEKKDDLVSDNQYLVSFPKIPHINKKDKPVTSQTWQAMFQPLSSSSSTPNVDAKVEELSPATRKRKLSAS
jgi:hypothetical protein